MCESEARGLVIKQGYRGPVESEQLCSGKLLCAPHCAEPAFSRDTVWRAGTTLLTFRLDSLPWDDVNPWILGNLSEEGNLRVPGGWEGGDKWGFEELE